MSTASPADPRLELVADDVWDAPRLAIYTERQLDRIASLAERSEADRFAMKVVASVLPFRVNRYVIDQLIDWTQVPEDPIFQLTFPQREMLKPEHFERMAELHRRGASRSAIQDLAHTIRTDLNPHPAGQRELNIPRESGASVEGLQHKYRETVLFFPSHGQTCHSYCTFCFRWAQFVGDKALRISANELDGLHHYLRSHPAVTDLLMTGGDPLVMKTTHLAAYLDPLTQPEFEHVQTIRLGTKSLTFWPHRFVTDDDADDLLRLFERLVRGGKHIALMAHYNHPRELEPSIAREAIRRIRDTGAEIRAQGPVLAHINDDPGAWARLWKQQVHLGIIPYYMFVERDTGARRYFEVPLARAWQIYREAIQQVSGLGRTVRGPSMSTGPGKVEVQGIADIGDERVFVLRFIQARDPDWVQRPFFARYDPQATWLDQLRPALGASEFFFEPGYRAMCRTAS